MHMLPECSYHVLYQPVTIVHISLFSTCSYCVPLIAVTKKMQLILLSRLLAPLDLIHCSSVYLLAWHSHEDKWGILVCPSYIEQRF